VPALRALAVAVEASHNGAAFLVKKSRLMAQSPTANTSLKFGIVWHLSSVLSKYESYLTDRHKKGRLT
jgi:hypothetical protein